jgi:peptide-methionine (R)-S-oxide reductase
MQLTVPDPGPRYHRRVFLGAVVVGSGAYWLFERQNDELEREAARPVMVTISVFDSSGRPAGVVRRLRIHKSENEWRKQLAVDEFQMTRRGDTELAFAGAYWNFHGDGLYRCVCCDTALFDSRAKFSSGTGWPSFSQPIARENIVESPDASFGISRTAVACTLCAGHLGHVFDDGPPPGGLRYCVNSVGLRFVGRTIPIGS